MSRTITTLASVTKSGCCDCCVRELGLHWQAIESLVDFRRNVADYLPKHGSIECDAEVRKLRQDVDELRGGEDDSNEIESLKKEVADLRSAHWGEATLLGDLSHSRRQDREEIEGLRHILTALRRDMDEVKTEASSIAVLETTIAELRDKVAGLQLEVAQLRRNATNVTPTATTSLPMRPPAADPPAAAGKKKKGLFCKG